VISQLRRLTWPDGAANHVAVAVMAVIVLGCGALAAVVGVGAAVLVMGLVVGALLALYLVLSASRSRRVAAR
jgi:hypothetical protein